MATTPTEIEGPFATKALASHTCGNITDRKAGYALTDTITITNSNRSCAALTKLRIRYTKKPGTKTCRKP
jgi:hypothetical protein